MAEGVSQRGLWVNACSSAVKIGQNYGLLHVARLQKMRAVTLGCYTSWREAPKNEIHDLTIQIRTLAGWLTTVTGHGKLASRTIASYLRWCYYATLGWNRVSLAAFGLYGT